MNIEDQLMQHPMEPMHLFCEFPAHPSGVIAPILVADAPTIELALKHASGTLGLKNLRAYKKDGKSGYLDDEGRFYLYGNITTAAQLEELLGELGLDEQAFSDLGQDPH